MNLWSLCMDRWCGCSMPWLPPVYSYFVSGHQRSRGLDHSQYLFWLLVYSACLVSLLPSYLCSLIPSRPWFPILAWLHLPCSIRCVPCIIAELSGNHRKMQIILRWMILMKLVIFEINDIIHSRINREINLRNCSKMMRRLFNSMRLQVKIYNWLVNLPDLCSIINYTTATYPGDIAEPIEQALHNTFRRYVSLKLKLVNIDNLKHISSKAAHHSNNSSTIVRIIGLESIF